MPTNRKKSNPPRLLDPRNDLAFKRVFGEHKHLCMSLINSLIPLEHEVVEIEYQSGEVLPPLPELLRHSIVDVRCMDSARRQFIVEMQMKWDTFFMNRVVFNASKAYVTQLKKGQKFELLQPVYALNLVNTIFETSPEKKDEYFHHYQIVNIKDTEKRIEGLEFVFVELPKFKPPNRAERKLHELWLQFLTGINENTENIPRELLDNELTREAVACMEQAAYTREELARYDQHKVDIMTLRAAMNDNRAEGRAEGLSEGEA